MLKIEFNNAQAAKKAGESYIDIDTTFENKEVELVDGKTTIIFHVDSSTDIDGVEFSGYIHGTKGMTISEPVFDPAVRNENFELVQNIVQDNLQGKTYFHLAITEKVPGTQDFMGQYDLVQLIVEENHGTVHISIKIT